jgi:hypothetical protein
VEVILLLESVWGAEDSAGLTVLTRFVELPVDKNANNNNNNNNNIIIVYSKI